MSQPTAIAFLEKVAVLDAQGVSNENIAEALGISRESVYEYQDREEYQKIIVELKTKSLERDKEFDEQWDSVEKRALDIVRNNLKTNFDPHFALKAALLANKAVRRGMPGNRPLNGAGGPKAIITLNQIFIGKLQQPPKGISGILNQVPEQGDQPDAHQNDVLDGTATKAVNMLNPTEVEKLLSYKKVTTEDGMITDIDFSDEMNARART